ncbi:MAG: EAL domain-containing protein [Clostridia bacterium]|nr:EAL domain-containing protein [Clostridia bacterium]
MGFLNIYEMVNIIRKSFLKVLALSIAIGFLVYCVANSMQTFTCVLGFKYNHTQAIDNLAPDGKSKLDPYEIQNPVVIQGALDNLDVSGNKKPDVNGIRQNIAISKVVTELDSEVSESAALLGEKYEAPSTEYEMKLTYKYDLGDEFGAKMFSSIIKEYDEFLLDKYYSKSTVSDFAKIVDGSSADYINMADIMGSEIDKAIEYLNAMANAYPDFRSKNTGYTFGELANIYQNIRNVQHAKYYGNIRSGNLAKDSEMVIKSYQTKVKELSETNRVSNNIAENYKAAITTFYDSYKAAGLYRQAENVQENTDSSNNRDRQVLYGFDEEEYKNTYDGIVTSYVENAVKASDAAHTINYYNTIITSFANDTVDVATKERLLAINEEIFAEIKTLSSQYSKVANDTIEELFATRVTSDLQYLIVPEVVTDVPVMFITVFAVVLAFGLLIILLLFKEIIRNFSKGHSNGEKTDDVEDAVEHDIPKGMNEFQKLTYEQYQKGFDEFYLVYQNMQSDDEKSRKHMETFIRWRSPKLGMVAPGKIIECVSELNIFDELNEWIINNVCEDIAKMGKIEKKYPIIHINCPHSELHDFAINDIIIRALEKTKIPADSICLELNGDEISAALEEIMLVKKMGISVCIDRFENSDENNEIISVIEPEYVKMSLDILNFDMYATTKEDFVNAAFGMMNYLSDIIKKCHRKNIKVCICGIEDKNQDNSISMLDIDYKQGYYYGKPQKLDI